MGWVYDNKMDFSQFRYLVIHEHYKPSGNIRINFYITKSVKGAHSEVLIKSDAAQTSDGYP